MSRRRRKKEFEQLELAFAPEHRGDAPTHPAQGTVRPAATPVHEGPADERTLMEEVCESGNMRRAYQRVVSNKGSPGVDGMTVEQLGKHLVKHLPTIRSQLRSGTYEPQPVKRVEIPKPDGGSRKLGIPTVLDRFIQQAVLQVLSPRWDPTFSEHSYGFRPKRSAHQAVAAAQQCVADGLRWVVDLDIEKFFDRVNHDRLMHRISQRVKDKRVLALIRAFLNAGAMENGLVGATTEGTPQGGPLSPLLSNLVLDELDKELEKRGHRFVRYADDCNVYVASERAGKRVMQSVTRFLSQRLRLRVNESKSAVDRPWRRTFLGFSFTSRKAPARRIAPPALERLRTKVRELTHRNKGESVEQMAASLKVFLTGWRGYFGFAETPSVLRELDAWIRRRLRCVLWKQWRHGRNRYRELVNRGVDHRLAACAAGSGLGPWPQSGMSALKTALPNSWFDSLGLPRLAVA